MGTLTSNRKRADECFSLINTNPSLSFDSPSHFHWYNNQIDTHIAKKPRIIDIQSLGKVFASPPPSTFSRLSRYPELEKLRRGVHAPGRVSKFELLSSGFKRKSCEVWGREEMGNALRTQFEKVKNDAIGMLRYVKVEKEEKNVIDVDAEPEREEVISKGWEKVKDDRRVGRDEGRVLVARRSDSTALINTAARGLLEVPDLISVESGGKVLSSVLPFDREAYRELLSKVDRSYTSELNSIHSSINCEEARMQSIRLLRKPKEERKQEELLRPGKGLLREPFVPLTEEEVRDVARAFSNSNRRKILVIHKNSNIQITGEFLHCLRPGAWLNDEVINLYLELLKERERREPKKYLNCHFFCTFFYKKLIGGRNGYDYKAVRRWTTPKNLGYGLLECDKIFVPIHKEVHWCLAVINKKDKSFQYLDSLGGRDLKVLRVLARYFADEVKDKSGQEIDIDSWVLEFVEDLPQQQNGFDCGVFMIKYADFYSRGMGLHFSQEHMPYFRLRTAKEILRLRAD